MFDEVAGFIRKLYGTREWIPLHEPRFDQREQDYVSKTIASTFVSSVGEYVDRFEDELARYIGAPRTVAVVNGTAALHVGLMLAGVEAEDLVITQPMTFIATCNAIHYLGAEPLFVDVDRKTLGIDLEKLSEFFATRAELRNGIPFLKGTTKKLAACVPMHTFGHMTPMDELRRLCDRFNIPVVEDAAESLGSLHQGKHSGLRGQVGIFSFNGNKIVTTGGGGALVCENPEWMTRAKHLTTTARKKHAWEYQHDCVGFNYRMPNLNAALGCAQLEKLDGFVTAKRNLAKMYREFFGSKTNLFFVEEPNGCRSNYWLNAVLCHDREERDCFLSEMHKNGILCRPVWQLMHKTPMYGHCVRTDLSVSEWLEQRLVNIPSSATYQTL